MACCCLLVLEFANGINCTYLLCSWKNSDRKTFSLHLFVADELMMLIVQQLTLYHILVEWKLEGMKDL